MACRPRANDAGSVMIITLWTIALLTVLVTALASQTRLAARVAMFHQEDVRDWAEILAAMNQAEMDLMLERQPPPIRFVDDPEELDDNPLYRYNGQELELYVPQPEGINVRIYDHGGKINLSEISRPRLRALLEHRLGLDQAERIDALVEAWGDWQDLNDRASANGAEQDYYGELDPPYEPRNGRFETVQEIRHIRGFDEVFAGVDLDAAFTVHGDENELINLNTATIEAMRLLPGLNDDLIREIVAWRRENEFRGNGDVARIVPAENMADLRPWLNSRKTTNFYTIIVYRENEADTQAGDSTVPPLPVSAYAQIVEVDGSTRRPRVLQVNPYQGLPLSDVPAAVE